MILSDKRILEEMDKGTILIKPFQREALGSNSYDVHLGKWLATYKNHILDAKAHNQIEYFEIPEEGFVLYPHVFYLGVTLEYTETHAHVPFLSTFSFLENATFCLCKIAIFGTFSSFLTFGSCPVKRRGVFFIFYGVLNITHSFGAGFAV